MARGKGAIEKLGAGRWRIRITLPRDPSKPASQWSEKLQKMVPTKQPTKSFTFEGTKKEADDERRRLVQKYSKATAIVGASTKTVAEIMDAYIIDKRNELRGSSLSSYRQAANAWMPLVGDYRIDQLTTEKVQQILDQWINEGLSKNYVTIRRIFLGACFNMQIKRKVPVDNPVKDASIRIPQKLKQRPRMENGRDVANEKLKAMDDGDEDTPSQVAAFIEYITRVPKDGRERLRWQLMWLLMLRTGMRISEACAVRWCDVDWKKKMLWITSTQCEHTDEETGKFVQYNSPYPKTSAGHRFIMIDDVTIAMLRRHQREEKERRERFLREKKQWINHPAIIGGEVVPEDELIFHSQNGTAASAYVVSKSLRGCFRRLKKLEAEKDEPIFDWEFGACTHVLRHTHASVALSRDPGCLSSLSKQLGHESVEVTLNYYSHWLKPKGAAIASIWTDVIGEVA